MLATLLHILVIEDDETVTVTWTPVAPEGTVVDVRLFSGLIGDDSDLLEFQTVTVGVSAILTSISFGSGSTAWASIEAAGYPTVVSAQYVQP